MKLTPRLKRALIMLSSASLLLAFGALASGETADALLRRYPYDPACPWGRIGNGKGLIVRCLTEAEAQGLRSGALPATNSPLPVASAPASSGPIAVAPVNSAPVPPSPADEAGLKDESGEVHVRFMLRQRGRAEGVSVAKRTGVSVEAARCVSDVVDRRYVGVPAEPMVGATVVIKFVKAVK